MKYKLLLVMLTVVNLIASAQSQITWTLGTNVAASSSGNEHPRVVIDAAGNPLVLWGHSARAMFSRWNGTAFTTPVMLNPMSMTIAEASWMGPDIASHGDTVYVVFKQTPEMDSSSHIYIVRSFDGGITFSMPSQVDFIADSASRFPTVAVDASGNPVVAFMKFDPGTIPGNARWVVSKSTDYGTTFTTDVKASGWSAMGATVCDCCPGSLVCEGNTVAMLYRDNNSNIRDSWAGISVNGAASFSNGIHIDQNNWMLMMCPSSGPDGVIIGDSLYSVFMNGASGTNMVYFNVASIISSMAQPTQLLTGSFPGLSMQNYPRIAQSGSAAAITWKQQVNGSAQFLILFTNDISNGFPAVPDTVDLNDITNGDVALANGNIYVVWEDDNSGTVKFRRGSYSPVGIGEHTVYERNIIYPNPASTQLNIRLKDFSFAELITIDGKKVLETKKSSADVSVIPGGIYFLKIVTPENSYFHKIVVQH